MDRWGAGKLPPATEYLVLDRASIVAMVGLWNLQYCSTLEDARELLETDVVANTAAGWCGQVSVKGAASNESGVLWSRMPTSRCEVLRSATTTNCKPTMVVIQTLG